MQKCVGGYEELKPGTRPPDRGIGFAGEDAAAGQRGGDGAAPAVAEAPAKRRLSLATS